MRIFDAIWAFRYHGAVLQNLGDAIFGHSLKTYGWVCIVVAAVLIVCAFLVYSGSQVGRWVGIVAGAIGCTSAIWWMTFYPIWSLTYIAIGVLVIYALAAYGGKKNSRNSASPSPRPTPARTASQTRPARASPGPAEPDQRPPDDVG